jgi:hypothetical protein
MLDIYSICIYVNAVIINKSRMLSIFLNKYINNDIYFYFSTIRNTYIIIVLRC